MSLAPNQLKQGAKLVTGAEEVMEELPTPVRAALTTCGRGGTGATEFADRTRAKWFIENGL
jgi:hypothetical protein